MDKREIHIIYGRKDIAAMAQELMENMGIAENLPKDARITLKPNFVLPSPAGKGATTHPEIAEEILRYFHDRGFRNLAIMESSWAGERNTTDAFRVCGYEALTEKYGAKFYDLKRDAVVERTVEGLTLHICRKPLLETDFLINLPVLKAHCQTRMTCALKNLKGCIPDSEKRRFHQLGLTKPIACLAKALPIHLTVVDAICGDLTFEEGGHPVPMDRLIGGIDPVLIDSYGASLLGFDATEIKYLPLAEKLGVGSCDLNSAMIREYRLEDKTQNLFRSDGAANALSKYIMADAACSVCYGGLIHALKRVTENGKRPTQPICIGQGLRGKEGMGIGIGNCTAKFKSHLPGCPPSAKEIADFLSSQI